MRCFHSSTQSAVTWKYSTLRRPSCRAPQVTMACLWLTSGTLQSTECVHPSPVSLDRYYNFRFLGRPELSRPAGARHHGPRSGARRLISRSRPPTIRIYFRYSPSPMRVSALFIGVVHRYRVGLNRGPTISVAVLGPSPASEAECRTAFTSFCSGARAGWVSPKRAVVSARGERRWGFIYCRRNARWVSAMGQLGLSLGAGPGAWRRSCFSFAYQYSWPLDVLLRWASEPAFGFRFGW